jgi:hypothetical protein
VYVRYRAQANHTIIPTAPSDPLPTVQTSTASILNFSPLPLSGSLPNAGQREEIPFSNTSSRNNPYFPSLESDCGRGEEPAANAEELWGA